MKLEALALITAAIVAAPCAFAGDPIDPASLAQVETLVATCRNIDAKHDEQYQRALVALTGSLSPTSLAEARNTSKYRRAHDEIASQLAKTARPQLLESCARLASS